MPTILVSGLINTETTVSVKSFPIPYYPIDYPYFGVNTAVSGVAYNIAKALRTLGDSVALTSITGSDFQAAYIQEMVKAEGMDPSLIKPLLKQTANSVVLYDSEGRRQIYCDLKDIQERKYHFPETICDGIALVAACNINFNRELLHLAHAANIPIATDVHVLTNIHDSYNREFMELADILFLSDEGIDGDYQNFLSALSREYPCRIIVLGRGSKGAAMYRRDHDQIYNLPPVSVGTVVNTVGAGDALFSAFLHFYAKGLDPLCCLERAQYFAAAKIRTTGAANGFITEDALEAFMAKGSV